MKNDADRLKRMIEGDRMSFTADGAELILKDISYVLGDYFNLKSKPKINVIPVSGGYRVIIEANADGIRAFGVMP